MNILIIEDFKNTGQIIKGILDANKFKVELTESKHYYDYLDRERYDLIILDLHIKNLVTNSIEILELIKNKFPNIFLIGISSKATWNEKVEFLNAGADDVIDYPFPIQELIARIDSLKRRPKRTEAKHLRMNDLEIDMDLKTVTLNRKNIPLRKKEYSLLEYLVKNKNRIVSRMELLDHVWDYRKINSSNTVDVHVKRLRDKINDRNFIKTVHGFGYTLSPKIEKKN